MGFGFSLSCSVVSRTPPPRRLGTALKRIAASVVCMTSTVIVRPDQPTGESVRSQRPGRRTTAESQTSQRVERLPSPVSVV